MIKWQKISDTDHIVIDGWDIAGTGGAVVNGQGVENYIYYGDY